ncbi:MAG: hypothetical protein ACK4SY_10680, partial [Pyrobaculum sp.]
IYFPTNISRYYYVIALHHEFEEIPKAWAFIGGDWRTLYVYKEHVEYRNNLGKLWLRIDSTSMPLELRPLSGRAVLVALCDGGKSDPYKVFDHFQPNLLGPYDISQWASLSEYRDGFTVVITTFGQKSVALYNKTWNRDWTCFQNRPMVGINMSSYMEFGYKYRIWAWHYDKFCSVQWKLGHALFDRIVNFTISVSPYVVLYQIPTFDIPQLGWWFSLHPNSAPVLGGRPMTAFQNVTAMVEGGEEFFTVAIIPFTWPRPYYYLDFKWWEGEWWGPFDPRGPFSTT